MPTSAAEYSVAGDSSAKPIKAACDYVVGIREEASGILVSDSGDNLRSKKFRCENYEILKTRVYRADTLAEMDRFLLPKGMDRCL